jgi:site-specific recombinase XerD
VIHRQVTDDRSAWEDVNFYDLLVTVRGKGNKQRIVPFSLELRKYLFKLQQQSKHNVVFATRDGHKLGGEMF